MRLTAPRLALATAILFNVAVLIALIALYTPMYPLIRGNSNDFWAEAARVDLRGAGEWGSVASVDGDNAYYMPPSMDAVWVRWLPLQEALADYPTVLARLKKDAADPANIQDGAVGYRRWMAADPTAATDIEGLIHCVQDATAQRVLHNDPPSAEYIASTAGEYRELSQQIERAHFYPANFVFEFFFLSFIIWFLLWPAIRRSSLVRAYAHLATTPFLFFLPSWFGYCAACINGLGPAGGIVYPYLLWFVNRSWPGNNAKWEGAFFHALPPLLEPINQSSWNLSDVVDPRWADQMKYVYIAGPRQAAMYGLIVCTGFLTLRIAAHFYRRHAQRRPGFEILPLTPSNTTAECAPPAPFSHSATPPTPPE